MSRSAGLDVGGAHLKVAVTEGGRAKAVRQFACPLWHGFSHLENALAQAAPLLAGADSLAITMTGELSDLFSTRAEGVARLVTHFETLYGSRARFWMGPLGFGTAEEARRNPASVASANFLATAAFVAEKLPDALLADMGSTTTDLVPIRSGRPAARGLTDAERLVTGELVYTGLTRTAVMAVATEAPFRGRWQGLCREYFATMADVRRILGTLPEDADQHDTADGRGKSLAESVARLARMFGRDAPDGAFEDWHRAAAFLAERQLRTIEDGCLHVLSGASLPASAPMVVAGAGAAVLETLARRIGVASLPFGNLAGADSGLVRAATACAPAVAVALLPENSSAADGPAGAS